MDKVVLMKDGRILANGTYNELQSDPHLQEVLEANTRVLKRSIDFTEYQRYQEVEEAETSLGYPIGNTRLEQDSSRNTTLKIVSPSQKSLRSTVDRSLDSSLPVFAG